MCTDQLNRALTPSQVHHAVFPAQVGLDLHGEANLFANKLLPQELSGLEGPGLQDRQAKVIQTLSTKSIHDVRFIANDACYKKKQQMLLFFSTWQLYRMKTEVILHLFPVKKKLVTFGGQTL